MSGWAMRLFLPWFERVFPISDKLQSELAVDYLLFSSLATNLASQEFDLLSPRFDIQTDPFPFLSC